jgi:hypothetical protein
MTKEKKKINKYFVVTIMLFYTVICVMLGFFAGTSIEVPNEINIDFDKDGKLEQFTDTLNLLQENITHNLVNRSCNFNVSIDEEFYIYSINSYKQVQKERKENVQLVQTFCKKPNTISTLHLEQPREQVFIELNKPILLYGYEFEIVGANDNDPENLILSINGNRMLMEQGDSYTNQNVTVNLEDIFVSTIPSLYASGNFVFTELKNGRNDDE